MYSTNTSSNTPFHDEVLTPYVFGALDLGTSNCRLLLAQPTKRGGFVEVERFSRVVRLGEGLNDHHMLTEAAMERAVEALSECARRCDSFQLTGFKAVATQACRIAGNASEFIERVAQEARIRLDVITHEEEVKYAFAGCVPFLDLVDSNVLLIDIGGGSTEFVWAISTQDGIPSVQSCASIPCGVVLLSSLCEHHYFPGRAYSEMLAYVDDAMKTIRHSFIPEDDLKKRPLQILCTSGTATSITAIHMQLSHYDRTKIDGKVLTTEEIAQIKDRLLKMSYPNMVRHKSIGKDRADFMLPGCAILESICQAWPIHCIKVANRGVREGIIFSLIAEHYKKRTRG